MTAPLHPRAARWLKRVLADPSLDDDAKLVARAVAAHMDKRGRVKATEAEIVRWVDEAKVGES